MGPVVAAAPAAIAVLLVDDSPVARRVARMSLAGLAGCTIVGEVSRGSDVLDVVHVLRPGVVLLDLDLPGLSGLEVIAEIMATRPTPIVVMSGRLYDGSAASGDLGARALAAGAVVLLAKPKLADGRDAEEHALSLRQAVALASRARVITHPRGRRAVGDDSFPVAVATVAATADPVPVAAVATVGAELIVVGASTGGPAALAELLGALPPDLGIPVLVVQHMSVGFIAGLASWLDSVCEVPVEVARDGERLRPGTVSLAPDGCNTEVGPDLVVRLSPTGPRQFHVPSVDLAFDSVASVCGGRCVGVLLTGMGRDGAAGLAVLRAAGALTLAQDEASSVVWGMPGAAVAAGAALRVLPLSELAAAVSLAAGAGAAGPGAAVSRVAEAGS